MDNTKNQGGEVEIGQPVETEIAIDKYYSKRPKTITIAEEVNDVLWVFIM